MRRAPLPPLTGMWKILVVEDDPDYSASLETSVARPLGDRARFTFASDLAGARAVLEADPPDLILLDIALPLAPRQRPDPRAGIKLLAEVPRLAPEAHVIVLSGLDRRQAVELLLSRRVDGYLFKDHGLQEVRVSVERALDALALRRSHRLLKEGVDRPGGPGMVAESAATRRVLAQARQVAGRDTSVLITGESGTGKEVLARFIHGASPRAAGPFVALSCAALPEGMAEAELFGAARGAYTGLDHHREGVMALARGGTLFLDEVGELPQALQPKLLRALQERTFRPLGAAREDRADFRLLCATHRDLAAAVARGEFREDLLFRMCVFPIHLPPLRERREDLPALVEHLITRFNREMGRRLRGIAPEASALLEAHAWPGNVRELANVIEYAFVLEASDLITPESLPALAARSPTGPADLLSLPRHTEAMDSFERAYLERALAAAGWHIGRAAQRIGLPRRTLQDRMARLGIRIRERTGPEA